MNRKKKNKSNVDQVLDDVLGEQKEEVTSSFNGDYTESEDTSLAEESAEPTQDEPAEVELPKAVEIATKEVTPVVSNLSISVAVAKPKKESEALFWKGKPAGELESLLRHKIQQFSFLHFGINVSLTEIDQYLLDKCAADYRFAREMEKLTRQQ